ncbi:MAG: SDR family NAD(P)-dependent oxidoreductase [Steroidobacteraceae bacterium]
MGATFAGKVVLITGASSGIGAELARALAGLGAELILLARRRERLESLASGLRAAGAAVEVIAADVTVDGSLADVVSQLGSRGKVLDILIANAGFGVAGRFQELSLADYRRQFETNVFSVLRGIYEALPALKASSGQVVIMGSVAGFVAMPGASCYAMSKFAVRALAESLRGDLAQYGIAVTHIAPGFVDSDIRRTNNHGELRPDAPDPVPAWLRVDTARAVRAMLPAIRKRRSEAIITGHGKVIVFLARHCSPCWRWLTSRPGVRARREPGRQAAP